MRKSKKKETLYNKYIERLQMEYNFNYLKANYDNIINYVNYYPETRNYYAKWTEQAEKMLENLVQQLDKPCEASFSVTIYYFVAIIEL